MSRYGFDEIKDSVRDAWAAAHNGAMPKPWAPLVDGVKGVRSLTYGLLAATLTLAWLRLRRPRPSFRRLARQPGFAACSAVILVFVVAYLGAVLGGGVFRFSEHLRLWGGVRWDRVVPDVCLPQYPHERDLDWQTTRLGEYFAQAVSPYLGAAVLSVWVALGLARVGRPEPRWLDRCGRLLGTAWVAIFLFSALIGLSELGNQ
jgi:hypothetical protein